MRSPIALAVAAVLVACAPALALVHSITDFRADSSTTPGDIYRLDLAWGDSLLLQPESFRYTSVKTIRLSDGKYNDGDAGSSPVAASTGLFKFKIAYLSWKAALHDNATAPPSKEAPRANIVTRVVDLSPDVAVIDDSAKTIASQENVPDTFSPHIFTYSNGPPAPTYLNFSSEGTDYVAYWGSGTPNGPVRRTTQKEINPFTGVGAGTYVPTAAPIATGGFGRLSSAVIPGSGVSKTVVAYETDFAARQFHVRWENLAGAGSSVVSAFYSRPVFPEDFAVAADSAENSLVLWREDSALYAVAFDQNHVQTQAPVLIQAGILLRDTVLDHMYRPYAVASLTRGHFIIAYADPSGPDCNISLRYVTMPGSGGWSVSAPVPLTANHFNLFPDIGTAADRVVIGYFQRPTAGAPGGARRFMGSILPKTGNTLSLNVGRTDLDFANENISFAGISSNWDRYHWFKAASVSIDGKGNVVAAYDSGTHAKVALVRNTPIYYDSGHFVSKSFQFGNVAIPAFVFNPATDSVALRSFTASNTDLGNTRFLVALSTDNTFSGAGSTFQSVASLPPVQGPASPEIKSNARYFKYRFNLVTTKTGSPTTTNLTSPKISDLTLGYNIKPWTPVVDSIRTGTAAQAAYNPATAYSLLPRKDSLKLVCSGFDVDDNGLEFRLSLGTVVLKAVTGTRVSPGNYTATITILPPDTLSNPLNLVLTTVDADTWSSRGKGLAFGYQNVAPSQTLKVFRNRGRDSSSVFRPTGGGVDTLSPVDGSVIYVQAGDSLTVKAAYADANDNSLTATWLKNSAILGTRALPVSDSLVLKFAPDLLAPIIDTLAMKIGDKDTTVTFRILVRPNRIPGIDSVFHASYVSKDGTVMTGPFDKVKDFAADTGLLIPIGLPATLRAGTGDVDPNDPLSVRWRVWRLPPTCAPSNPACYVQADSGTGSSLTRTFTSLERFVTVRVTDLSGAFLERRVWMEYPILDTTGNGAGGYAAAIKSLTGDIAFTIDAARRDTSIRADISSQGTAPLQITSVATKGNDRKWVGLKLNWISGTTAKADSARFTGATNVNALTGGKVITLAPGSGLAFDFHFFSDSLRGDSVLTDTLLVQTNDFANPVLKIPFKVTYRDLPLVRISVPGSAPAGPSGGFNASGLPRLVPARSTIAIGFTETVRILQPATQFRVYSLLDSLKNPASRGTIAGTYAYKRKAAGLGKVSAFADSLADTVVFTPAYDRVSDSLKVRPNPGFFIHRDILRIELSNGITDLAGNALDLRLDRNAMAPGSLDTAFQAKVDTSYLAVVSTEPARNATGWSPESPIRIRFNRKLSKRPPFGTDTLTRLDPAAMKGIDNHAVRVTSVFRKGKTYDFQILSLADNDSSLLIRTRPLLPALDSVTVTLSGGILDTSGLSLDGNGNRLPEWLYDQKDTVDQYTLTFTTSDADFYIFPNPFRFSDSRHREKGSITFKNLNSLRGYALGEEVVLRIHTMTGDLVYNSAQAPGSGGSETRVKNTSLDWELKNDHGNTVGTGVYIYTLTSGKSRLLHKGKVAVVR